MNHKNLSIIISSTYTQTYNKLEYIFILDIVYIIIQRI